METNIERGHLMQALNEQWTVTSGTAPAQPADKRPGKSIALFGKEKHDLKDGTEVTIRVVRPGDVYLLREMHFRLSKSSIYYRYLNYYTPTIEDFQFISRLAGENGLALVATLADPIERIIGVAYFVIDEGDGAEPAFLVEDAFQGKGLGRLLFNQLVNLARRQGVQSFNLHVDPANRSMLKLIQASHIPYQSTTAHGARKIHMSIN